MIKIRVGRLWTPKRRRSKPAKSSTRSKTSGRCNDASSSSSKSKKTTRKIRRKSMSSTPNVSKQLLKVSFYSYTPAVLPSSLVQQRRRPLEFEKPWIDNTVCLHLLWDFRYRWWNTWEEVWPWELTAWFLKATVTATHENNFHKAAGPWQVYQKHDSVKSVAATKVHSGEKNSYSGHWTQAIVEHD